MTNLARLHEVAKNADALRHLVSDSNNPPLNVTKSAFDYGLAPLCERYGFGYGRSFDYSVGAFLELLLALGANGAVAASVAIHPNLNIAMKLAANLDACAAIVPILPCQSLDVARQKGAKSFVLSLVNDEIFSRNAYTKNEGEFFVYDASLALSSGVLRADSLPQLDADALLLEGETLGLARPFGAFLQRTPEHAHALFAPQPPIIGLGLAFCTALEAQQSFANQSALFWEILHDSIPALALFAPLHSLIPNALPLRFAGIKARALISACAYDEILIVNGRRCLFGLSQPSYVLESLGFCDAHCRELIALSFGALSEDEMRKIARILKLRYAQVLALST
ncbi:MAG: hypothetical protein K2N70_01895 [Helicobacter sp.]|nr:hypothetical protein [Helicobacter sp.]